ncbi:hypothetical protein Ahy_B09g095796 [Arachis hypogaea]|uniref:Peptidyl-prolyl cis-trans isomerase n=1 Tax=Arachis hypogaea TaxID=3818 RepID=A0A444XGF1_ARAHY|nr:hypothetical protein Ahy_B09g095796 [Arachis hypogaea]
MSSSSNRHGGDGGEVRASDILVKHHGSRCKVSWKDPEGQVIKKTTRDSAISQLKAFHDDIVSGKAKFEDIASRFSDCSSAKRVGNLGQSLSSYNSKFNQKNIYLLSRGSEKRC